MSGLSVGRAELDVYAVETVEGREYRTAVECKNWATPVPQHVVHAFRTIVADAGVNTGYVVSRAGFQAGAHEAAGNTNIRLVTWSEFQQVLNNNGIGPSLLKRSVGNSMA